MRAKILDRATLRFITVHLIDRHDLEGHPSYLTMNYRGTMISGRLTAEEAGEAVHAMRAGDLDALGAMLDQPRVLPFRQAA